MVLEVLAKLRSGGRSGGRTSFFLVYLGFGNQVGEIPEVEPTSSWWKVW